jgi:hypothetical protein
MPVDYLARNQVVGEWNMSLLQVARPALAIFAFLASWRETSLSPSIS